MKNDNAIPLETAQEWATKWVESQPAGTVKAHLIPMKDFIALSEEQGVVNIRAYIGVDGDGINKLMLVGVDENEKDMISSTDLIYDFTKPCPTTCDTNSPLFIKKG